MNGYRFLEDDDELNREQIDEYEALLAEMSEDDDESSKRRRLRRGPPKTASGGYYRSRPDRETVTQTQLQASLARVEASMKTNSDAIKSLNSRINALSISEEKQNANLKKKVESANMTGVLPLLLTKAPELDTPKFIEVTSDTTIGGAEVKKGTKLLTEVAIKKTDDNNLLLPIALMSGMGGGGGDNSMMMMVLALSMMNKK